MCSQLRHMLRRRALPSTLAFCVLSTLANLALHDVAANEMLAYGAAELLTRSPRRLVLQTVVDAGCASGLREHRR